MAFEPLGGWREVAVTDGRRREDWARFVRDLVDGRYRQADKLVLVMDQLWSCPVFVDGSGGGGLSVCLHLLFVANGRAIPQGGVPPGWIVEALDEAEAGHACLDLRGKAASLE